MDTKSIDTTTSFVHSFINFTSTRDMIYEYEYWVSTRERCVLYSKTQMTHRSSDKTNVIYELRLYFYDLFVAYAFVRIAENGPNLS